MSELGRLLRNEAGPGSLPWWVVAAGAAVVALVVGILVVCAWLDWRRARQERRASRTIFPKPPRTRPLAWVVPGTELTVLPRPAERRRAA
jgi:hypothetical protein